MIQIQLDGQPVEVAEGSMVMHAADAAGVYIPHFCYHKKLTIAANCRMCLVEIEKAPKPMPACATPVTQGMVVRTHSEKALKAQQSVMEFLLINHPLDCPICDQGGECQLQDLAVGYGGSSSRYSEEKRVVFHKDIGPLISAEEMTRCIHCTRCVRFGLEVAGVMELGMIHRGEHSEITTVTGDTVDSELSGNMIDLCPVGALTSRPFRYKARNWELSRRKSVSPHDSTGTNLIVQVKGGKVMRVLPLENEAVNECWIADRDRFSYEALNGDERLTTPMVKQNGVWQATDWPSALEYVSRSLQQIKTQHGAAAIGGLGSPHSTLEELHLLGKLVRGLGSQSVDHRLRHADGSNVGAPGTARWLGMPVAALSTLQRVLVVGSFLRKDHPLFAQRLRQAAKRGAKVHSLHAVHDDWLMPIASTMAVAPSGWVAAMAEVAAAVANKTAVAPPVRLGDGVQPGEAAVAVAASLLGGDRKAILLGNAAMQHPQASQLLDLAQWLGEQTGASVGCFGEAANSVGAQLVDALPGPGGLSAAQMLARSGDSASGDSGLKACLLLQVEPAFDAANSAAAVAALQAMSMVVAMTPFKTAALDCADVLLPIAPFTETAGTFVSAEGRVQSFHGVVKPLGETRPAWKVLRVLGNVLGLTGFDYESSDEVRSEALPDLEALPARLSNAAPAAAAGAMLPVVAESAGGEAFERIADVPIYCTDSLVRRALPLQQTADARAPAAGLPASLWSRLRLDDAGARPTVRVSQDGGMAVLPARLDTSLAANTVRVATGHPSTQALGAMFGRVTVEKA